MVALFRNLFGRTAPAPRESAVPPASAPWRERGNAALAQGNLQEAGRCYSEAMRADPADPLARFNLGFVLLETGAAAKAEEYLTQAIALRRPGDGFLHDAHYLLGRALAQLGQPERALAGFQSAIDVHPDFPEALEEGARLLYGLRRYEEALQWAQRLQAARACAGSDILVAQQLHFLRRNEHALALLDDVVAREPDQAEAWMGRGHVLLALARVPEAIEAFERAESLLGATPAALAATAGALQRAGRLEEALQRVELALQQDARHGAALLNRISTLAAMLRIDAAIEAGRQALAVQPANADIHWNLATVYLLAGRFEEGWREYEWRWQASLNLEHPLTGRSVQWTGADDLRGRTLLLFAEQGLGDTFQMLRYLPQVAQREAHVFLHLPPSLHGLSLTRDLTAGVTVLPAGASTSSFDFHCALMSLPLAFGTTESSIPGDVPYLRAQAARIESWRARLEGAQKRLKVGLVWSGNPAHVNDSNRSIALATLRGVAAEGCLFVSLQQEVRETDRAAFEEWADLLPWGEELTDFDDTAGLIEALDLVIAVDTSVAHLAGALGRPVWILLPHCPDWRWMIGREDSPWYPSARLYRQSERGDWPSVLARVRRDLEALAAALP